MANNRGLKQAFKQKESQVYCLPTFQLSPALASIGSVGSDVG